VLNYNILLQNTLFLQFFQSSVITVLILGKWNLKKVNKIEKENYKTQGNPNSKLVNDLITSQRTQI